MLVEVLDGHILIEHLHRIDDLLIVLDLGYDSFVLSSHLPILWGRGAHNLKLALTFLKVYANVNKTSSHFRCLLTAVENHFYVLCHNFNFFLRGKGPFWDEKVPNLGIFT